MSPAGNARRFWETRAAFLAFRLNVAVWLERFCPAVFALTSLVAVVLYALRRLRSPVSGLWIAFAVGLALAAAIVWWIARRRFFSASEARVLLESRLRLDTRLTAASQGMVEWPPVPAALPSIVRWRLAVPAGWVSSAAILLILAAVLPVPEAGRSVLPTEKPPALAQAEALLNALAQTQVPDSTAIEQMAERARELAHRPTEEQYSHSALEAADALRDQTLAATAELDRHLESAAQALESRQEDPASKNAADQLSAALTGLREGSLPANADLLKQMTGVTSLKGLTPEQLKALADRLADAANKTKGVLGAAGRGANVARPDPNARGNRPGRGQRGGPGGRGGGEASAPLALADDASDAGDGKAESLSSAALANLSLGDKLGTTSGAHDVDPAKAAAPISAGLIAAPAKGGEAVWVNRLTPAERAALKEFYK
jgi:hypothetical protein